MILNKYDVVNDVISTTTIKTHEYSIISASMEVDRITAKISSLTPIDFLPYSNIAYHFAEVDGKKYILFDAPVGKNQNAANKYEYTVTLLSEYNLLTFAEFADIVNGDEARHTDTGIFSFFGSADQFATRLQTNIDARFGSGKFTVTTDIKDRFENYLSFNNVNCLEALKTMYDGLGYKYYFNGDNILITDKKQAIVPHIFEQGKNKGLVDITRAVNEEKKVYTRIRPIGGTRNLPANYKKDALPLDESRYSPYLMLPNTNGYITTYVDAPKPVMDKFGLRPISVQEDFTDIYPSIANVDLGAGRIDEIVGSSVITGDNEPSFWIYVRDWGFNLDEKEVTGEKVLQKYTIPAFDALWGKDILKFDVNNNKRVKIKLPPITVTNDFEGWINFGLYGSSKTSQQGFFFGEQYVTAGQKTVEFTPIEVGGNDSYTLRFSSGRAEGNNASNCAIAGFSFEVIVEADATHKYYTNEDAVISMTDGAYAGNDFVIVRDTFTPLQASDAMFAKGARYKLKLNRTDDSGLIPTISAPNEALQVGSHFVILNIYMPNQYVNWAEERLKTAAIKWLADHADYEYSNSMNISTGFAIDNPSIVGTMQIGNICRISDEGLGLNQHELEIQSLTIQYTKESAVPKYTCSLSNYKYESSLEKLKRLIQKGGSDVVATTQKGSGGITGGGSYDDTELINLINDLDKNKLSKTAPDKAQKLIDFLGGANFGDFVKSLLNGKGAGIDSKGNAQFESVEVRGYMKVMEMIINRKTAMEGDFTFTEAGNVDAVTKITDTTYKLHIRKRWDLDFTAFKKDDIIYAEVNNLLSTGEYYTIYMRVLNVNTTSNELTVVMYPAEECPTGKNFPPITGINVSRRGNVTDKERQDCWYISSYEGVMMFLTGVDKPILEEYNYALSLGKPKNLKAFENLPINYDQPYVYARGAIIQDLLRIRYNGKPLQEEVPRGLWSASIANSDDPYRTSVNSADTVYHANCKWKCIIDKTTEEPRWNATGWVLLEGDTSLSLAIKSTNGAMFRPNAVDTTFEAYVYRGQTDITGDINAGDWSWTRDSGNPLSDVAWNAAHTNIANRLPLTSVDMGDNFSYGGKVKFTCIAYVRDGETVKEVQKIIQFNL